MIAIGFGVLWLGYLQTIYGWCLLKGYNVTWRQLANPVNPYQWPKPPAQPPLIPNTQIMPGQAPATTAASSGGSSSTSGGKGGNAPSGIPPPGVM